MKAARYLSILIIVLLFFGNFAPYVKAEESQIDLGFVKFYSEGEKANIKPGDTFRVWLYAEAKDLYGLSVDLLFDPKLVKMISAVPFSSLDSNESSYPLTQIINTFDLSKTNQTGQFSFATTITGPVSSTEEKRWGTRLLELTFEAMAEGQFSINITNDDTEILSPTGNNALVKLSDSNGHSIAFESRNLNVNIQEIPAPDKGFFGIVPDQVKVMKGEQFTVNVVANNIPDIYAAQFKLKFDPTKLQVKSITPGDLISGTNTQTIAEYDNNAGTVEFARTYTGPATTKESGALVSITFEATNEIEQAVITHLEFVPFSQTEPAVTLKHSDESNSTIDPDSYSVKGATVTILNTTAVIQGYVRLNVPGVENHSGIQVTVLDSKGNEVAKTTTQGDGSFIVNDFEPVENEKYTIKLKKSGYLLRVLNDVSLVQGINKISDESNPITLWAGDVNDDNKIDITDLERVAQAFFTFTGETGFDAAVDYNGDGFIDLDDLHSLAVHYYSTPDDYPVLK